MDTTKKKPEPARVSGSSANNSTPEIFASLSNIRRRFGRGIWAYEYAKSSWLDANPSAGRADRDKAMRRIARAVGI